MARITQLQKSALEAFNQSNADKFKNMAIGRSPNLGINTDGTVQPRPVKAGLGTPGSGFIPMPKVTLTNGIYTWTGTGTVTRLVVTNNGFEFTNDPVFSEDVEKEFKSLQRQVEADIM